MDNAGLPDTSIAHHKNLDHWRRLRGCGHERVSLVDVEKRKCFAKKLPHGTYWYTYVCTRKNDVAGVQEAGPAKIDCGDALTRVVQAMRENKKVSSAVNSVYTHDAPALSLCMGWLPHQASLEPGLRERTEYGEVIAISWKTKKVKPINEKTIQF